jgi:predicted MPP superfamily phosphohydrolase
MPADSPRAISSVAVTMLSDDQILQQLEQRLGKLHARQRIGIERDHEAQIFGYGLNFFHPENWYAMHSVLASILKITGVYWWGERNAAAVQVRHNTIASAKLPPAFDGFTLLHLSDLHADSNGPAMARIAAHLPQLRYDLCVWTGDFRGKTVGDCRPTIEALARLRNLISSDVLAVLGNHDSILMVPELERLGIRVLLNEALDITREQECIHIVGIDDAHFFRVDNIEKAAAQVPIRKFSILLSHTPEIYRQAAHAGFDVLLGGHTHGGQICLPGSIPITLDATLPRRLGAGPWKHHNMAGYTSVGAGTSIVPVRFNCPPEITLHVLRAQPSQNGRLRSLK